MNNRAILYARVSTDKKKEGEAQDERKDRGQDPEMQFRDLRDYCQRRGWEIVGEHVDVGVSGAKDVRPALTQLMDDVRKRRCDIVVVWRFDRMARSTSHLLRVLEEFKNIGVEFISFSENIDTSTPMGKMIFTVLGAVAELERSLIAERVRGGLRNAVAKGKKLGRPKVSASREEIVALKAAGRSFSEIAAALGISKSAAHSLARSEAA